MTEVNRERVALLADALESGEYEKGIGSLHRVHYGRHSWCCLGVAGDVACRNGLQVDRHFNEDGSREFIDNSTGYLGENVAAWYGFPEGYERDNPTLIMPDGKRISAITWNDSVEGSTFADIAAGFRRAFLADEGETG